jgi:hypothetical protein
MTNAVTAAAFTWEEWSAVAERNGYLSAQS